MYVDLHARKIEVKQTANRKTLAQRLSKCTLGEHWSTSGKISSSEDCLRLPVWSLLVQGWWNWGQYWRWTQRGDWCMQICEHIHYIFESLRCYTTKRTLPRSLIWVCISYLAIILKTCKTAGNSRFFVTSFMFTLNPFFIMTFLFSSTEVQEEYDNKNKNTLHITGLEIILT